MPWVDQTALAVPLLALPMMPAQRTLPLATLAVKAPPSTKPPVQATVEAAWMLWGREFLSSRPGFSETEPADDVQLNPPEAAPAVVDETAHMPAISAAATASP